MVLFYTCKACEWKNSDWVNCNAHLVLYCRSKEKGEQFCEFVCCWEHLLHITNTTDFEETPYHIVGLPILFNKTLDTIIKQLETEFSLENATFVLENLIRVYKNDYSFSGTISESVKYLQTLIPLENQEPIIR